MIWPCGDVQVLLLVAMEAAGGGGGCASRGRADPRLPLCAAVWLPWSVPWTIRLYFRTNAFGAMLDVLKDK